MYNFYDKIVGLPEQYRQFTCGESLITLFNCPLENKFQDLWSHHNYIVYVIEGKKIWHTPQGSFDLQPGSCVLVRKGSSIVEQFFDARFCIYLFFITDDFISSVLKHTSIVWDSIQQNYGAVVPINKEEALEVFFHSMSFYFKSQKQPDPALLELKFRELVITIASNPANKDLRSYFYYLLQHPHVVSLQKIMEENFCFNLQLEEFARLSNRSLSAFKRDFEKQFNTTPGKWLMEKRLAYAKYLLSHSGKTVHEASFESGFESPAHFSRSFRKQYGIVPSAIKQ